MTEPQPDATQAAHAGAARSVGGAGGLLADDKRSATATWCLVAEGIETAAQLAQLRLLGCGCAQGLLQARPLSVAQVDAMLPAALAVQPVAEPPAGWRDDFRTANATADAALRRIGHPAPHPNRLGATV